MLLFGGAYFANVVISIFQYLLFSGMYIQKLNSKAQIKKIALFKVQVESHCPIATRTDKHNGGKSLT